MEERRRTSPFLPPLKGTRRLFGCVHFGCRCMLGVFWVYVGCMLGLFWVYFGVCILGASLGVYFGCILGVLGY